jgi:hypothetical protein
VGGNIARNTHMGAKGKSRHRSASNKEEGEEDERDRQGDEKGPTGKQAETTERGRGGEGTHARLVCFRRRTGSRRKHSALRRHQHALCPESC